SRPASPISPGRAAASRRGGAARPCALALAAARPGEMGEAGREGVRVRPDLRRNHDRAAAHTGVGGGGLPPPRRRPQLTRDVKSIQVSQEEALRRPWKEGPEGSGGGAAGWLALSDDELLF